MAIHCAVLQGREPIAQRFPALIISNGKNTGSGTKPIFNMY
jgi:hypothetical protein